MRDRSTATVLVANPGSDVYGSDLQMIESVKALVAAGYRVVVATPGPGALTPDIERAGATPTFLDFPVLRRTDQSVRGLIGLGLRAGRALPRLLKELRRHRASVVYVNTVTIPWWLVAGRLVGARTICHIHEAEGHDSGVARAGLYGPLLLANANIMISQAAMHSAIGTVARISRSSVLIANGVPDRPTPVVPRRRGPSVSVGVVARLSPRKGTMDALEAVELLRRRGHSVELHLYGSTFEGYEWYEAELRAKAASPLLAGAVHFHGYVRPIWGALDQLDIAIAPSHIEPFGNSVVEAQYSGRPVVASRAEGHCESIIDGVTGLLFPIGDIEACAAQLERLIADPALASSLADRARTDALDRNGVERYSDSIVRVVDPRASSNRRPRPLRTPPGPVER